jgi:hypothetical protein
MQLGPRPWGLSTEVNQSAVSSSGEAGICMTHNLTYQRFVAATRLRARAGYGRHRRPYITGAAASYAGAAPTASADHTGYLPGSEVRVT